MNSINDAILLFQDKQVIIFLNWLVKDKRRLSNIKKVLNILINSQEHPLTFIELSMKTKIRRTTLSAIIKKMRLLGMIADYETENIVHRIKEACVKEDGTKEKGTIEYAVKNKEGRTYYRYRYKFINLARTSLILAAIIGLNVIKKKCD